MKKSRVLIALAVILALAVNVCAQDEEEEEEGRWRNFEVMMFGGFGLPMGEFSDYNDSLGAKTGLNFGMSGGYFLNDRICLGGYFHYTQFGLEEPEGLDLSDMHYKMYNAGLYLKYAFTGESNFEPYIKLSAGANFAKFATWVGPELKRMREVSYDPGLSSALSAGFVYYTSEWGGLSLEASYHFDPLQANEGDYFGQTFAIFEDLNYLRINAGVTVFFGPEE